MLKAHLLWELPAVDGTTLYPAPGVAASRALRRVWAKRQIPGIFYFHSKEHFLPWRASALPKFVSHMNAGLKRSH